MKTIRVIFERFMFCLILMAHFLIAFFKGDSVYGINYTVGWRYSVETLISLFYWYTASYVWILYVLGYGFLALLGYTLHWGLSVLHFLSFIALSLSMVLLPEYDNDFFLLIPLISLGLFILNIRYARKIKKM
ncbi:hypothetical protein [Spongiimicrobium salis]|uniref:hypothetical protein n=1 Tax=Spongiimicrobium salis TaxID=1667022 RepID=UPI00374D11C4